MWLSPFGQEVVSAAKLPEAIEVSNSAHENRKEARAVQYAALKHRKRRRSEPTLMEDASNMTDAGSSSRSKSKSRWRSTPSGVRESALYSTCTTLDDGTIILRRCSLSSLRIGPQDHTELVCDIGFEDVEEWVVIPEYIPECGFFGLDNDDIRRAIEGLNKATSCDKYEFESASDIRVCSLCMELGCITFDRLIGNPLIYLS